MKKINQLTLISFLIIFMGCSNPPDAEQIKADLIGKTMRLGYTSVEVFESLSNFRELTIREKKQQGDVIEYSVSILYFDAGHSRKTDNIDANIVYKKTDGKWEIATMSGRIVRYERPY